MDYLLFLIYSINQCFYLTSLEIILICIAMLHAYLWKRHSPLSMSVVMAVYLVVMAIVLRTEYPTIHGDGESGYISVNFDKEFSFDMVKYYPKQQGRLQCYLHWFVDNHNPFQYTYHKAWLNSPAQVLKRNNSWITLQLSCVVLIAVTWVILAFKTKNELVLPLCSMLFMSPYMLNAFGHFDSYIIPVMGGFIWFGVCLYHLSKRSNCSMTMLMVALSIAIFAHPINMLYLIPTILLLKVRPIIKWPLTLISAIGLLYQSLDMLSFAEVSWWIVPKIELTEQLFHHIHIRTLALIGACIPSIILWFTCLDRKRETFLFGLASCFIGLISFYTMTFSYGMIDELAYYVIGVYVFACTYLMCSIQKLKDRGIWGILITMFFFMSSACVYHDERILKRERDCLKYEMSKTMREVSPYMSMGLRHPCDTVSLQDNRLSIFKEAFTSPSYSYYNTPSFKLTMKLYYIAWGMEFNQDAEVLSVLEEIYNSPQRNSLSALLAPGCFFTSRSKGENQYNNIRKYLNTTPAY